MDWIDSLLPWRDNVSHEETDVDSIDPLPWRTDFSNNVNNSPTYTTTCGAVCQHPHHQTDSRLIITAPARFDVVGGRGRGVQRLPGNETYRELVCMNKRVYATCHKYDKGKVSRGIVAAIREIGGRFLEYDKQSKTYHDIGDKKAWGKTSQALREGLQEVRQQIYSDLAAGRDHSGFVDISLPTERYFECSVQMLQSLHNIINLVDA